MSENENDLLKKYAAYCSRHGKADMFRAITFEELDQLNEMLNDYYKIHKQANLDDDDFEEFLNIESKIKKAAANRLLPFYCTKGASTLEPICSYAAIIFPTIFGTRS